MPKSDSAPAAQRHTVSLLGFAGAEREALAAFLRGAARRVPAFHQVHSIALADLVIADADDGDSVREVIAAGRLADAVFIGARAPTGAGAWLGRPFASHDLERSLARLAAGRVTSARAGGTIDLLLADLGIAAARGPVAETDDGANEGLLTALVVDGSGVSRKFLAERLEGLGYRVLTAANTEEALERVANEPVGIVFTEVAFPSAGDDAGLALCREIKRRGARPAVVLVSGLASPGDRVRGSLAGADGYVGKPVTASELEAALRKVDPRIGAKAKASVVSGPRTGR